MNKFSDGFSDSSYEDLLNEYAGESLGSRVNRRAEPKKEAPVRKEPPVRKAEPPKRKAPAPAAKAPKKSSDFSLDLNTIKTFEEEMSEKTRKSAPVKRQDNGNDIFSHSEDIFSHSDHTPPAPPVIEKRYAPPRRAAAKPDKLAQFKKARKAQSEEDIAPKEKLKGKDIAVNIKRAFEENKKAFLIFACCFVVSIALSSVAISCINDIFAINRDSEEAVEVVLPNDADTDVAVEALHDAGLIKNQLFCKIFIKFKESTERPKPYLPGVYYFTETMGVEKMISRFKTSSVRGSLVSITIPEGFTLDQIFEKLEKNDICSASSLYTTVNTVDFSPEYDFIKKLDNKQARYHQLEGYMFPATYEFEQGADPAAVIRKFLDTFNKRWTEEYQKRAAELSMSVDDVITLASIIEKEGNGKGQFYDISSVLHNRLNLSGLYPTLGCDSTIAYVEETIKKREKSPSKITAYAQSYNTYKCEGLPVGAICNPGTDAIDAALNPTISKNYFFRHDDNGKIYLAETSKQHDANGVIVDRVNAQKK